ncbi:hypothetical protein E2C01_077399 [Portunus trituberculatus]|uniref:Uncharacterized protein n=1 Tax=Portunus trituberculatus TaxID=210409 RepID=A0A5B7IM10_PORTR|nr:hypothetical protein [Portunus trituberculatus]
MQILFPRSTSLSCRILPSSPTSFLTPNGPALPPHGASLTPSSLSSQAAFAPAVTDKTPTEIYELKKCFSCLHIASPSSRPPLSCILFLLPGREGGCY